MSELFKDKTGKVCGAKTWFTLCSGVVLFKFLFSSMTLGALSLGPFDAASASMLIGAFGGVYWGRSHTKES